MTTSSLSEAAPAVDVVEAPLEKFEGAESGCHACPDVTDCAVLDDGRIVVWFACLRTLIWDDEATVVRAITATAND